MKLTQAEKKKGLILVSWIYSALISQVEQL